MARTTFPKAALALHGIRRSALRNLAIRAGNTRLKKAELVKLKNKKFRYKPGATDQIAVAMFDFLSGLLPQVAAFTRAQKHKTIRTPDILAVMNFRGQPVLGSIPPKRRTKRAVAEKTEVQEA